MRGSGNGRHTTIAKHMPSAHCRYADWTIERIRREATAIGACTAVFCDVVLAERPHPEQGFRACLGILRLVIVSSGCFRVTIRAICGGVHNLATLQRWVSEP